MSLLLRFSCGRKHCFLCFFIDLQVAVNVRSSLDRLEGCGRSDMYLLKVCQVNLCFQRFLVAFES